MIFHADGISLGRVSISSGVVLALGVLLYTGCGVTLKMCLLAAVLHELGHLLMCYVLCIPVRQLSLSLLGAVLEVGGRCSEGAEEITVALAGVVANMVTAFVALRCVRFGKLRLVFVGASAVLAVFNLLPVQPLDGSRALHGVLSLACPSHAERITVGVSRVTCVALVVPAVAFAIQGNGYLLLFTVWMLSRQQWKELA